MRQNRSLVCQLVAYAGAVAAAFAGMALGVIGIAMATIGILNQLPDPPSSPHLEQAKITQMIEDAREVREAIAKQLFRQAVARQAPIPSRLAGSAVRFAHGRSHVATKTAAKRAAPRHWAQARAAFAKLVAEPTPDSMAISAYAEFDRHAVR